MREPGNHRAVVPTAAASLLLLALAGAGCRPGAAAEVPSATPGMTPGGQDLGVLAVVDGAEVTLADLEELIGGQLGQMDFQYNSQRHQLIERATRSYVRDRLIEDEAARRGIAAGALLEELYAEKIDVTDDEIRLFYMQNQAQLAPRTLEQLHPQIRQYLEGQIRDSILDDFTDELAAARDIDYVLGPFRVELDVADAPAIGPADAPVTMVEFSDFECPYCRSFAPTVAQIRDAYENDVRIVFLQFPLRDIHPRAAKAAEASLCAHEQGKFWETHDLYFAEQDALEVADLKDKAGRVGLDTAAFDVCLDSGKYAARVAREERAGAEAGVSGTPAVFVNGRPLPAGAVPFEMVAEIIDEEIERARR